MGCEHSHMENGSILVRPVLQHPVSGARICHRAMLSRPGKHIDRYLVRGFLPANCGIAPKKKLYGGAGYLRRSREFRQQLCIKSADLYAVIAIRTASRVASTCTMYAMREQRLRYPVNCLERGDPQQKKKKNFTGFCCSKNLPHGVSKLVSAANKAMHAMNRRCAFLHISDPKQRCKLFDSLVLPILSYASKVWAVDQKVGESA